MKTKNKALTVLTLSACAIAGTALLNQYIKLSATSKNILQEAESCCFKWRLGDVHYKKTGSGKPLLLIHDLNSFSGCFEWEQLSALLKENHTVYSIDLLGCGLSEKPNMTYTNYLYVQMLSDFIKSVIGHRVDVIASGSSGSIVIMACSTAPELFDRLILSNPESILESSLGPGKRAKALKCILDFPVLGTLLYHIAHSKKALMDDFIPGHFFNPYTVISQPLENGSTDAAAPLSSLADAYYESAHLGKSPKSVYASIRCCYTRCNISNALKKIDNSICLIGGAENENEEDLLKEYQSYNSSVEYTLLPGCKKRPETECPERLAKAVGIYLN